MMSSAIARRLSLPASLTDTAEHIPQVDAAPRDQPHDPAGGQVNRVLLLPAPAPGAGFTEGHRPLNHHLLGACPHREIPAPLLRFLKLSHHAPLVENLVGLLSDGLFSGEVHRDQVPGAGLHVDSLPVLKEPLVR